MTSASQIVTTAKNTSGTAKSIGSKLGFNDDADDVLKALRNLATCVGDLADSLSDLAAEVSRLKV